MRLHRRSGFTLVELLVVIGILAVLAGLLFPALAAARRKGHQAACQSNLRQIGIAISMYTQDNDGMLPSCNTGYVTPVTWTWRAMVYPYARNAQMFMCPAERMSPAFDGTIPDVESQSGYAINAVHWQMGPPTPPGDYWLNEAMIGRPAETIDVTDGYGRYELANGNETGPNSHGFVRDDPAAKRHLGGANYLFCDGHVKSLKPSAPRCDTTQCDWSIEESG